MISENLKNCMNCSYHSSQRAALLFLRGVYHLAEENLVEGLKDLTATAKEDARFYPEKLVAWHYVHVNTFSSFRESFFVFEVSNCPGGLNHSKMLYKNPRILNLWVEEGLCIIFSLRTEQGYLDIPGTEEKDAGMSCCLANRHHRFTLTLSPILSVFKLSRPDLVAILLTIILSVCSQKHSVLEFFTQCYVLCLHLTSLHFIVFKSYNCHAKKLQIRSWWFQMIAYCSLMSFCFETQWSYM